MVRHRAGRSSRRRSSCCATTACSSATATRSPPVGIGLLLLPRLPGHRPAGQRRLPRRQARADHVPAGRVRQDRDHHLPGQLPARHAPAAGHRRAALRSGSRSRRSSTSGRCSSVWGAAMLMLVLHPRPRLVADVLRRLPGRCSTWPPTASRSWPSGWSLFAAGVVVLRHARPDTCRIASTSWLDPFGRLYDARAAATRSPQSLFAQADGGLFGSGFGQALLRRRRRARCCRRAQTDLIYSVIVNELGPDRRLRGADRIYLLLAERGFKIATLARDCVLEAAGHRPDRGVRAAGLRDRRRRHARDPADRRDAAVHLLRRLARSWPTSCCWRCCC